MNDDDPFDPYGLVRVRLDDKPVFDEHFRTCRPRLSDYTFANTFIWRDSIHLRWRRLGGCLCVFANGDEGLTLLFPPLGDGDPAAAAREALAICRHYHADHGVTREPRIEYVSDALRAALGPGFQAVPMSGDYVYATSRMIDLAGGDLASKRQARNKFARLYAPRTEPLGPHHVEACAALMHLWRRQCDAGADPEVAVSVKRCKEVLATYDALQHADALGLRGMVLYAHDRIVGFTLGEYLDAETCSILIEKTDRAFSGSAQYIFSEFCRQAWADTRWCNVGDDWEVPSLAWTKQSYRPSHRLTKWVVRQEVPVTVAVPVAVGAAAPAAGAGGPDFEPPAFDAPAIGAPVAPPAAEAGAGGPPFELGRAALTDLDRLFALDAQCFERELAFTRRQWRHLLRSPNASTPVVRSGGEIVAEAILLRRRTRRGTVGRLYSLAVGEAHRGKGFGKVLLGNCLETARAEGLSAVYLEVEAPNAPAIGLYRSFGFVPLRRLPDYYGPGRHGRKMVLRLGAAP